MSALLSSLPSVKQKKAGDMLLTTGSPSPFPWWNKSKLPSFIASKEPGAAPHKVPFPSVTVKQDARRLFH